MTPERFRQVEQLAMLVLEQDEGARTDFLDKTCSGDGELREEVESLLASDEKAGDFLAEPAAQLVPERLASTAAVGRYIIERELGSGGMGLVYAAYDPELGRKVAIKLVRPASSARMDPSRGRARLLREAQAMAQVTHPNVVPIHDVGTFGDQVFIAMEYVEGSTLTQWLSAERRGWREIVSMFAQAGRGLAAAHAKNIVHRDFKADNVWVGEDGRARVLDFGLARATRDAGEEQQSPGAPAAEEGKSSPRVPMLGATVTQPGTFLGTPPYMAPEQLRGESGDARTDQFSFCVALYYALYGELPFTSETVASLLAEMERRRIKAPPKSSRVPSWLRRVLLRGLSADRADRYDSMDRLLEELTPRARRSRWPFLMAAVLGVAASALVLLGRPGVVHIASIAVLPLKNLSGDPRQDYFVDGMTEAVITELGKIGALQVLSYQSTVRYRQTAKPLPQIARELKVDAFLEGAVLHSGERVRITAKLVQSSPERQLWAESYDFDRRDILAAQGEVARDVASRIRVNVTPLERVRLTNPRRVDSEAYEAYLLGRDYSSKTPTRATWMKAKEYFEKAIEKDPGYAPPYAGLAALMQHRGSLTRKPEDARLQARQWAEKALELDDTLGEAHATLARVALQQWDWAGAEREYRRAIELNPSNPQARIGYAMYLYGMLRFEDAVGEARRAQQLDPVSPIVNTWAGAAYFFAGRVEEAMASWQKALELDPSYFDASLALARTYVRQGRYQLAIAELQRAVLFNEKQAQVLGALAHALARAGQREEALKLVSQLKRIEAEERGYFPSFGLIWAYAGLGDKEQAFAHLETSYQERRDRMIWLNVDPLLDPLRSDPRFEDLVRRVGLPTQRSR
jgi:serine/threonine-protein kinase